MPCSRAGGRTAHDDEVVVFVLGMRVNRWRAVRSWAATFRAMPRMLAELSREQERGMLQQSTALGRHGPEVTTYWRSLPELLAYAHDTAGEHRPAWRAFNAAARRSRRARSASGTRRTSCRRVRTSRSTATCPSLGWPPPRRRCP